MKKEINWEKNDLYIIVHHHDEHITDKLGLCHRLHIIDIGTMIELHDRRSGAVPERHTAKETLPPKRTTRISGLTRTILPVKSFEQWLGWFCQGKSRPIFVLCSIEEDLVQSQMSYLVRQADDIEFLDTKF
jgi:hypothetical protein